MEGKGKGGRGEGEEEREGDGERRGDGKGGAQVGSKEDQLASADKGRSGRGLSLQGTGQTTTVSLWERPNMKTLISGNHVIEEDLLLQFV